ncbi:MAG: GxxExxY protein [Verrucomicrobia bacterium]|nr:MAG: GxxExxY protein [Verrucomicrobiota bacterium]
MHSKFQKADQWSHAVIGAAIEVHKTVGPGLLESVYEKCLLRELELQKIPTEKQVVVPLEYKGCVFEEALRLDILVELKAVETILPVHKAVVLSYMKMMDVPLGLLINFHEPMLTAGLNRLILPGANQA